MNNIKFRFLNEDDRLQYIDLISSSNSLMTIPYPPGFLDYIKDISSHVLSDPDYKVAGGFDQDKLVYIGTGYYPQRISYWYGYGHYSNLILSGLNYKTTIFCFLKVIEMLTAYGESQGYYSFYVMRELQYHQSSERARAIRHRRGTDMAEIDNRYNLYYDMIYPPNTECKSDLHTFFFNKFFKTFPVETVVLLHTLAQEHRLKLLNLY
jgi:hypothetical protein